MDISFNSSDTTSADPSEAESLSLAPSYLVAADNHNYGNGNSSWYDPSTWADNAVGAGKFAAVSLASGLNSFYNTGVTVANWLGADAQENDVTTQLSALDDDLGQYYKDHKESADMVGFIATSFIPGLGGVKVLNAGQKLLNVAKTGEIGLNMSRATGLLAPDVAKYTRLAASELAQSSATFSSINTNTVKALVAGAGQAALESAAFETAVAATMFKSPVLENQDIGDIVKNIATGTVLGGAIGGVLHGAGIFSKIRKTVSEADELEKPWTHVSEYPTVDPSARIIGRFDDLETMKSIPIDPASEFAAKYTRLAANKETRLMNLVREDMHNMVSGKDAELGNLVADSLHGLDSEAVTRNLLGAKQIARVGDITSTERLIKAAVKAGDTEAASNLKVGYVKVLGEGAGGITFDIPRTLNLADNYSSAGDVLKKVGSYGFKESKPYDIYGVKNTTEAEARYIWADKFAKIKEGMAIHENDLPLLERALQDKVGKINLITEDGARVPTESTQDLFERIQASKEKLATQLVMGKKFTTEEIAKITNTKLSYVEGERSTDLASDLLARQDARKKYTQSMIDKGLWDASKGEIDTSLMPTHFKVAYDTKGLEGVNNNLVDAMSYIKTMQKANQQGIDNVFSSHAGEVSDRFYHPPEDLILKANRQGAGPGLAKFANGSYGSLASWSEQIGAASNALIKKRVGAATETLDPVAYKLANNQSAAIEFQAINNQIAASTEKYVLNEAGDALIPRKLRDYRQAIADGSDNVQPPKLQEGAPVEIAIKNPETLEAIQSHINLNGQRVAAYKDLRAAQGLEDGKSVDTFYPIRPNPQDYPHFAFVVDPTVTGVGHMSMIHAASPKELEALINKVPENYKVITKGQSEEYHKALGDYDFDRTLHENYIDSDLKSKGVNTPFFAKTDPQVIARDLMQYHTRQESVLARELVNGKFEKEFTELRRLGEQATNISASKYGGTVDMAEKVTKNPYLNYIKTALDINQSSEYPLLQGFNSIVDKSFSRAWEAISPAWKGVKTPEDLEKVNTMLQQNGVKSAYYDAALNTLVNKGPNQGLLKSFVSKANSIVSTLTLRLDPLNAINNAVGANVLLGAETKSILRAIESGNSDVAGQLAGIAKVGVPGTEDSILSAPKLIANSMQRYFGPEKQALLAEYKKNGWVTSISDQYHSMLDDLTIRGTETGGELNSRISSALAKAKEFADSGEKITGNKLAEEFNRFVAADVMKQVTDLGIQAGVIGEKEALSYINTFVNRTQGNILASQRPLMFQGAVGQAVGLFQTYQFNMIQQLLRHVGEGSGKDAATLLGLQGTIYGMNGLPGFNFINQHIVGTASGNPQHRDLFDFTYGAAGKAAGDWLLYGMPSNLLHTNLYSRGDINPRQVTVIPTNLKDIPAVNAIGGFFGNLKDTAGKIGAGGNVWETILQGIEHNGLSRPLAGIAQTLQATTGNGQVYSTKANGNIMGANDFLSLTTLSRIAGGRPFDEAIVNDATYRIAAYQAVDHAAMGKLNSAIKTTLVAGQQPSSEQMEKFVGEYTALGGKQQQFNRHVMDLFKQANTAQANVIAENMKTPYAQSMQRVMGGNAIADGRIATQMNAGLSGE